MGGFLFKLRYQSLQLRVAGIEGEQLETSKNLVVLMGL